jgi:hypothetical protein
MFDQRVTDIGDDFAQYIQHAQNIQSGRSYFNLPYPFNPQAQIGPPAYPPVYPLVLSPFVKGPIIRPLVLRIESTVFLGLSLVLLYKIFQLLGVHVFTWNVVLVFTFLPGVFMTTSFLGSTIPYLFFSLLALWTILSLPDDRPAWIRSLISGLLIAVATLTRDIGIALWGGTFLFFIYKSWKRTHHRTVILKQLLVLSVAAFALLGVWNILLFNGSLHSTHGIYFKTALGLEEITVSKLISRIFFNGFYFCQKTYELLFPLCLYIKSTPVLAWIKYVVAGVILGVLGWQLLRSLREPSLPITLYLVCYLTIFSLMDFHVSKNGVRTILPLAPFLVFYLLKGIQEIGERFWNRLAVQTYRCFVLVWLIFCLIGTWYCLSVELRSDRTSFFPEGPVYQTMVRYIKEKLPASERIAYIRPRYLSLYTGHPTVVPPFLGPPSFTGPSKELLDYLRKWNVSYVLLDDHFKTDENALRRTIDHYPSLFAAHYRIFPLSLYRFINNGQTVQE